MALSLTPDDIREIVRALTGRTRWFVNKSGNDTTGDGKSPSTAYLTINKAKSVLANGDDVCVEAGDYTEAVDLSAKTDVAVFGGSLATNIKQTTGVDVVKLGSRCTLSGLRVTNTTTPTLSGEYAAVRAASVNHPAVYDCYIDSNDIGIIFSGCTDAVANRNVVRGTLEYGISFSGSGGYAEKNLIDAEGWSICDAAAFDVGGDGVAPSEFGRAVLVNNNAFVRRANAATGTPIGVNVYDYATAAVVGGTYSAVLTSGGAAGAEAKGVTVSGGARASVDAATLTTSDASPTGGYDLVHDGTGALSAGPSVGYATGKVSGSVTATVGQIGSLSTTAKSDIVTSVYSATLPGAFAAGTAGYILGTNLNAKVGDVPTAMLASTVDTVTLSNLLTRLQASTHKVSATDNGDGTYTFAFKKQDGTTTAYSITYNPTTGART